MERDGPPALPVNVYLWGSHRCGPRSELRDVGTFTHSVSTIAQRAFPGQKPGTKMGLNT